MKKLGIYIHIPFCVQKCLYCDFCSFPRCDGDTVERYVSALCRDIERQGEILGSREVDTVYFGGGTPTLLPISAFERIMAALTKSFNLDPDCSVSSECNPATVDLEYLMALRALGVNRLSIGLQSADGDELRALGRIHSFEDFKDTFADARRAGFEDISVDLMYGIPRQTVDSFKRTLCRVVDLAPDHISAYGLKVEEGTPFGRMGDRLVLPDEDEEVKMYILCSEYLREMGYNKYEISNFARKGYESRHNLRYWRGEDYIGLGVSAHSYIDGVRFANSRDIEGYISGADIVCERAEIGAEEQMTEYVMLRMRLAEGVSEAEFRDRFGIGFLEVYGERLSRYIEGGYVIREGDRVAFSDRGFFLSNYILSDILDF